MKETRETDRIQTVDQFGGNRTLIIYTEFIDGEEGLKMAKTLEGQSCKYVNEKTYVVVATGQILNVV